MASALKMLSTANTTAQAATVVIGEPQLSSLIRRYGVRIQGGAQNHTCSAKANSDVVHSQLDGLQPNTVHTALVKACRDVVRHPKSASKRRLLNHGHGR